VVRHIRWGHFCFANIRNLGQFKGKNKKHCLKRTGSSMTSGIVRQKSMVVSRMGLGTKNDCGGDG
jgi:hypothetical protein